MRRAGAFYRAHAAHSVPLTTLVQVAGSRWKVEEGFAGGKERPALDEHQVRRWESWRRWVILALATTAVGPPILNAVSAAPKLMR
jgi:hypothetical protein